MEYEIHCGRIVAEMKIQCNKNYIKIKAGLSINVRFFVEVCPRGGQSILWARTSRGFPLPSDGPTISSISIRSIMRAALL